MRVRELIAQLQALPDQDLEVDVEFYRDEYGGEAYASADSVYIDRPNIRGATPRARISVYGPGDR